MSVDASLDSNQGGAPAGASVPAPSYPADYEELRQFRDQYAPVLNTIQQYADDIRPIIEDDDQREFIRSAREQYTALRKQQEESAIDPVAKTVIESVTEKFQPALEYVQTMRERETRAEQQAQKAALDANLAYAQRLVAERPDLAENNYKKIMAVAQWAQQDGISFEEGWKRYGSYIAAPAPGKKEPPTSLRGSVAAPGTPGESKSEKITSAKDLRARMVNNLRAAGMKG